MSWKMPAATYKQRNEQLCLFSASIAIYYEIIVIVDLSFFKKKKLYFVKESNDIFSTEASAQEKQGQNSGGHIKELLGPLEFRPSVGHFGFVCD